MRTGIITGEYPPMRGGVGAFSHILGVELAHLGHDVFILTSQGGRQLDDQIRVDTVDNWGWQISNRVNDWVRDHQLDVVNLQYQTAAFGMSPWIHFLPNRAKVPFVTTFHDLRVPYLFPKAGPLRAWIVQHLVKSSSGRIVTNEEDQQTLKSIPQTRLIRIGSNIRGYTPQPNIHTTALDDIADGTFVIGFFGFINHSKGLDVLIRALSLLDIDRPTKLLIIGDRVGDSDMTNVKYADEIDALIAQCGVEDHVIYTGYVTEQEVAAYLRASDIVVLPYRDGASFRRGTLLAAIEQECAIVTTLPLVSIDAISDNSFCLIPTDHPEKLATAIQHLATDASAVKIFQENVKAVKAQFTWETIAQETEAYFADLTGSFRA